MALLLAYSPLSADNGRPFFDTKLTAASISSDLSNNRLVGAIPAEIGALPSLKTINLSNNNINGTIPAEIGRLTRLENINLQSNQLWGRVDLDWWNLTALQQVNLDDNSLWGTVRLRQCSSNETHEQAGLVWNFGGLDCFQTTVANPAVLPSTTSVAPALMGSPTVAASSTNPAPSGLFSDPYGGPMIALWILAGVALISVVVSVVHVWRRRRLRKHQLGEGKPEDPEQARQTNSLESLPTQPSLSLQNPSPSPSPSSSLVPSPPAVSLPPPSSLQPSPSPPLSFLPSHRSSLSFLPSHRSSYSARSITARDGAHGTHGSAGLLKSSFENSKRIRSMEQLILQKCLNQLELYHQPNDSGENLARLSVQSGVSSIPNRSIRNSAYSDRKLNFYQAIEAHAGNESELDLEVGDLVILTQFLDSTRAEAIKESTGALGVVYITKILPTTRSIP
ncbi:uncharacterized protein BJ171DRAFT_579068 [Polychytrium aggregatum]|uniref:uncharacterized protein n=1 Tax=Polychytrium aggregatum TaxID=110093 RepID=UPI0022FE6605|nr:uncharacterized protein BJ171DRAFT_579068 [Polychytrium aggregatum]KAI9207339.1 hypothetical protein BJ171DRAFT_579068 [Polychytrium aggregatum]